MMASRNSPQLIAPRRRDEDVVASGVGGWPADQTRGAAF